MPGAWPCHAPEQKKHASRGAARPRVAGIRRGGGRSSLTARCHRSDRCALDVNLNGRLSFPIAATFRRRGVPVVFASGYQLRERPPEGFEDTVSIGKPNTAGRLDDALCTALDRGKGATS
jgi:hypothetical protein